MAAADQCGGSGAPNVYGPVAGAGIAPGGSSARLYGGWFLDCAGTHAQAVSGLILKVGAAPPSIKEPRPSQALPRPGPSPKFVGAGSPGARQRPALGRSRRCSVQTV